MINERRNLKRRVTTLTLKSVHIRFITPEIMVSRTWDVRWGTLFVQMSFQNDVQRYYNNSPSSVGITGCYLKFRWKFLHMLLKADSSFEKVDQCKKYTTAQHCMSSY